MATPAFAIEDVHHRTAYRLPPEPKYAPADEFAVLISEPGAKRFYADGLVGFDAMKKLPYGMPAQCRKSYGAARRWGKQVIGHRPYDVVLYNCRTGEAVALEDAPLEESRRLVAELPEPKTRKLFSGSRLTADGEQHLKIATLLDKLE